jgi:hypothetical protein
MILTEDLKKKNLFICWKEEEVIPKINHAPPVTIQLLRSNIF